jgi:hypothetical protein
MRLVIEIEAVRDQLIELDLGRIEAWTVAGLFIAAAKISTMFATAAAAAFTASAATAASRTPTALWRPAFTRTAIFTRRARAPALVLLAARRLRWRRSRLFFRHVF